MWSRTPGSRAVALVILLLVTTGSPNEPPGTSPTTGPAETLATSAGTVTDAVPDGKGHANTTEPIDESGVQPDGGLNSGDHDASAPEEAAHPSPTDTNAWVGSTTSQNTTAEESVDQKVSDEKLDTSFPLDPPENSSLSNHQENDEKETAEDTYESEGLFPVWGPLQTPLPEFDVQEETGTDKPHAVTDTPSVPKEENKAEEETFGGGFGWGPLLPPQEPSEATTEAQTPSVSKDEDKTEEHLAGEEMFGGGFGWGPLLPPQEPSEAKTEAPTTDVSKDEDKTEEHLAGEETFGGGFGWGPLLPPQEPTEATKEAATTDVSETESEEQFPAWGPPPAASLGGGFGWGPLLPPAEPTEPPLFRDVLNQEYGRKYPAVAPCIEKAMCTTMLLDGTHVDMLQTRCHCDVLCRDFRDCCVDIDDVELLNTTGIPAAVIHPDSCQWRCGRTALFSQVSCGCDAGCKTNGTCCDDYRDVCGTGSPGNSRQDAQQPLQCGHAPNATDHYWMVASCPEQYPVSRVRTLCEAPGDTTDDLLLEAPVVENVTGVPYRNMFCGICNGAQQMVTWETQVLCTPGLDQTRVHTNLSGVLSAGLCVRQAFRPSTNLPARRCFPPLQPKPSLRSSSMCDETECRRLTAVVYQKQTGQLFRNGYCLGCVYDIDTVAAADIALSCRSLDAIANERFSLEPQSSEMSAIRLDAKAIGVAVGDCENDSVYDPYENTCRDLGITFNFQTASKVLDDISQKYLYIALNILSLLSLMVFACFLVKERKRLNPSMVAKISLLVALLLAQGSQVLGDVSSSPVMCKVAAVGKLLFSLVALLTVTLVMRYLIPPSGNAVLSKGKVAAHVAGPWVLAVLVVTVLLVADLLDDLVNFVIEYDQSTCWLDNSVQTAILLGMPATLFTLMSCGCLAFGFVGHRRTQTSVQFTCFAEGALLIMLTTGVFAAGVLAVTHDSAALDIAFKFSLACLSGVLALVFILSNTRNASDTRHKQDAVSTPNSNQEPDGEVAENDATRENEKPL